MLPKCAGPSARCSYPQMHWFKSILLNIVDSVYPKRCVGCNVTGSFLCSRCIEASPRAITPQQTYVTALFDYKHDAIRSAIWRLKYGNIRALARSFAEPLYNEIVADLSDQLTISKHVEFLLVPIPLHKSRYRERGYNQSELLARAVAAFNTNGFLKLSTGALMRTRETKSQAKKDSRSARLENLRGAFAANADIVRGQHIILIDDVITTGATLAEARSALLMAGARSVVAYTIAH